jgi:hypothetical protein
MIQWLNESILEENHQQELRRSLALQSDTPLQVRLPVRRAIPRKLQAHFSDSSGFQRQGRRTSKLAKKLGQRALVFTGKISGLVEGFARKIASIHRRGPLNLSLLGQTRACTARCVHIRHAVKRFRSDRLEAGFRDGQESLDDPRIKLALRLANDFRPCRGVW